MNVTTKYLPSLEGFETVQLSCSSKACIWRHTRSYDIASHWSLVPVQTLYLSRDNNDIE